MNPLTNSNPQGRNPGDSLQIKIGRENAVNGHSKTWSRHFRDFSPRLLFPGKSPRVPFYKKVEKLVLKEVEEFVKRSRDPSIFDVKGAKKPCLVANCELLQLHLDFDPSANDLFRQCQSHRGF